MFAFFISFALYLSILIGVGIYGYQKNKGNLNGDTHPRTINYWVTALSAHAADMSIWLFFGLPGAIYFNGLSECWVVVGLIGGMWATWHFVAPKLRVASETTKSTTLTNFLCTTAGDTKGYLTLVSSCLLLFFFLFYIAVGFSGIGTILMFTFSIPHWLGIIASAIFVTGYVSLGGYATVAFIDAFQGFFLSCMIVLIPLITAWKLAATGALSLTSLSTSLPLQSITLTAGLATACNWGLGYIGMPSILTKFMSIDSVKNMKKAQYVGLSFQAIALTAAMAVGLLARLYFTTPPASSQQLFLRLIIEQCIPLIAGFVLCALLAATISTLDSQLIVCASVISHDICKSAGTRYEKIITSLGIAAITGIAAGIALLSTSTLHEIVRYAWSGLGCTFGPLVLMSLYAPKRLTTTGALAGILLGGGSAALWPYYGPFLTSTPLVPGFSIGLISMYLLSQES
jgi:sodium/proline symporter